MICSDPRQIHLRHAEAHWKTRLEKRRPSGQSLNVPTSPGKHAAICTETKPTGNGGFFPFSRAALHAGISAPSPRRSPGAAAGAESHPARYLLPNKQKGGARLQEGAFGGQAGLEAARPRGRGPGDGTQRPASERAPAAGHGLRPTR